MSVTFFPTTHSVPEASFLIIKSKFGVVLHTGDFKIDKNPILEKPIDYKKLKMQLEAGLPFVLLTQQICLMKIKESQNLYSKSQLTKLLTKQRQSYIYVFCFKSR